MINLRVAQAIVAQTMMQQTAFQANFDKQEEESIRELSRFAST